MFKKSLAVIFIVIALCFSFAACGSDTKNLEARIAELEQQLEAAQGIQGPKGDTGEQGPKGDKGDGITVSTEPLALGTIVNVLDSTGLVLFTVKAEETDTHWVVTVTNVNMVWQFKADDFIETKFYSLSNYWSSGFGNNIITIGSSANASIPLNFEIQSIAITNKITQLPYALYQT